MFRSILLSVVTVALMCTIATTGETLHAQVKGNPAPRPAGDHPPFGKKVQIDTKPVKGGPGGITSNAYTFNVPVEQGDKFKFELSPVNGAAIRSQVSVWKTGSLLEESKISGANTDWTMKQGAPGGSIRVIIRSSDAGKFDLIVTKLGEAVTSADEAGDELKRLKAENAELKKQLGDIQKQLADQKKQFDDIIELLKKKM